ncbi:MAG: PAS domain S-box protein, partial [Anaerolineae bacterium]|nr:PAS domain S-box protein [Anaerolineae bacterium]
RFVNRYRCKDGTYRWLSWTATVVEEEEIIIATARDITAEKQMRADLQASEARYQQMFTRHKAVMLLIDPETGQIVDANPAAAEFYGYHQDKLITLKITDINVLPALEVQAEMELARLEKRNFFVFPHRLASGEIRDVEVHSGPVDLQGQELLISIIFDVTERKRAQLELQKSEARFRRLAEYASVGIYESTVTGDFLYGNPALAKILQQASVELMTQSFTTTFYKNLEDRADFISRLQQHGTVTDFEAEFSVKDGTKHVLMSAALQGETLLGTIVDITERKLAEKQLHQTLQNLKRSNEDLQQFAYVASHDLQEPLRMVSSYLELLEKRYKGQLDERADKYIQFAIDGAVRMKRLINDLLTYSRLTRRPSSPARTNLNDALQNVLKNLEFLISESGSQIQHDLLPVIEVDATQVELLLQNLLSNAIKFCGEKRPQIQIQVQQTDSEWVFAIRDNGIGIEPVYQEQIFTIFKRLHTREEYEGNGIGLAVCKRVVEQHNGRIWLESQLGQGTTFFFTLPIPGQP